MRIHRQTLGRGLALIPLALLFILGNAPAQEKQRKAVISGMVMDRSGAVIPGATVTLKLVNCKCEDCSPSEECKCCPDRVQAKSDSEGRYNFSISAGKYTLQAEQGGRSSGNYTVEVSSNERSEMKLTVE